MPVEGQSFCLMLGMRHEDMELRQQHLIRGRSPKADNQVALGTIAQRMLDKDLGEEVRIGSEAYRVVGIFHLDLVFFDGAVIVSLPRLQRLAGREGRVTVFQVRLQSGADAGAVVEEIERCHPELVAVCDPSQYDKVDQGLVAARGMVWAVSFVALVVGSVIVMNTMWMAVLERTREIGALRAVGWSRRRIVFMIVSEAVGVGLIACLVGCLLGVGLAELATILPVAEQFIEPVFGVTPFLLALAVAVLLSVLGALLPAWRAARISPAEALRYE